MTTSGKATPRFSVVIPTYNRARTVRRAIVSVLCQRLGDLELIVVDDGSTDETPSILKTIEDQRIRIVRQENRGVSAARNAGARASRGAYVTFLDDDDEASPEWLEGFASALIRGSPAVRCGALLVDPGGRFRDVVLPSRGDPGSEVGRFLAGTFCLDRNLFHRVGGYAQALRFGENTELAIRVVLASQEEGWSIEVFPRTLVRSTKRIHGAEVDSDRIDSALFSLARHDWFFREYPRLRADYLAIVGVGAARQGDGKKARRYLWRAWTAYPGRLKSGARWMGAILPPVRRLIWPPRYPSGLSYVPSPNARR